MSVKKINVALEKYKKITPPDILVRTSVAEVIRRLVGADIPLKDISIRRAVVYIRTKPIFKNEIYIKKKDIINAINVQCPQTKIEDIR